MPRGGSARELAFDRLRGLVMTLMVVDHAAFLFSAEHVTFDSAYVGPRAEDLYVDGTPWHFLTRWITHLYAPVFLFLVGTSLARSVAARRARGESEWSIDRHLLGRGVLLILCELWMSLAWGMLVIQVLWAIGATLICMVALRRLPPTIVGLVGVAWIGLS